MMSLELNARKWWECSGDELWTMNLRRPNFVAQDDECQRRGGNQALGFDSTTDVLLGISHVLKILLTAAFESSLILLKLKSDVATL